MIARGGGELGGGDVRRWRADLEIDLPVGSAFAGFCDVERLGEWVPHVTVTAVHTRLPGGLVERVGLQASVGGHRIPFEVRCSYDVSRLYVRWQAPPQDPGQVGGTIAFLPLGPRRCLMRFEMFEPAVPMPWPETFEESVARTRAVLESFKRWAETRG